MTSETHIWDRVRICFDRATEHLHRQGVAEETETFVDDAGHSHRLSFAVGVLALALFVLRSFWIKTD